LGKEVCYEQRKEIVQASESDLILAFGKLNFGEFFKLTLEGLH
jgi:hypothetical protein